MASLRPLPSFLNAPSPSKSSALVSTTKSKTTVQYRIRRKKSQVDSDEFKDGDAKPSSKAEMKPKAAAKGAAKTKIGTKKTPASSKTTSTKPVKSKSKSSKSAPKKTKPPETKSKPSATKPEAALKSKAEVKDKSKKKDDEKVPEETDMEVDEAMKLFKKLDEDGSGTISLKEFKRGLQELRGVKKNESSEVDIPEDFECPLTMDIMVDPVINENGNTFERTAITEWYAAHDTDPLTNDPVPTKALLPNRALRDTIKKFCKKHKIPLDEKKAAAPSPAPAPVPAKPSKAEAKAKPKPKPAPKKPVAKKKRKRDEEKEEEEEDGVILPIMGSGSSKKKAGDAPSSSKSKAPSAKKSKKKAAIPKPKPKPKPVPKAVWSWKSDLYADDAHDYAWTPYSDADNAKLEAKYQEDPTQSFPMNGTYSVDLADLWQYRTSEPHRRRPIRRVAAPGADYEEEQEEKMDEEEAEEEEEEDEEEEEGRWFWKSDLDLSDKDPEAWTQYVEKDSKKIETKYQEGKKRFKLNSKYSVDLTAFIQHQTRARHRQRPIKRHPPADGWEEEDEDEDEPDYDDEDDDDYGRGR